MFLSNRSVAPGFRRPFPISPLPPNLYLRFNLSSNASSSGRLLSLVFPLYLNCSQSRDLTPSNLSAWWLVILPQQVWLVIHTPGMKQWCSLLYPWCLARCLIHSRCSKDIPWMNESPNYSIYCWGDKNSEGSVACPMPHRTLEHRHGLQVKSQVS